MNDEFADAIEAGSGSATTWNEKEQKIVFGTYKHMKTGVGPNDSNVYILQEDSKDDPTSVWGSTVLDTKFEEIPLGSRVKIEFLGMATGKRSQYKDYKVVFIAPKVADAVADAFPGATVE